MLDASNPHILADHVVHGPVDPETDQTAQSAVAARHEANDNHADPARVGERRTFELPRVIWIGMIACYVVFLAALLAATPWPKRPKKPTGPGILCAGYVTSSLAEKSKKASNP